MSIHFISPATLEFTGHISAWRRQPQAPSELSSLNKRQLPTLGEDISRVSYGGSELRNSRANDFSGDCFRSDQRGILQSLRCGFMRPVLSKPVGGHCQFQP